MHEILSVSGIARCCFTFSLSLHTGLAGPGPGIYAIHSIQHVCTCLTCGLLSRTCIHTHTIVPRPKKKTDRVRPRAKDVQRAIRRDQSARARAGGEVCVLLLWPYVYTNWVCSASTNRLLANIGRRTRVVACTHTHTHYNVPKMCIMIVATEQQRAHANAFSNSIWSDSIARKNEHACVRARALALVTHTSTRVPFFYFVYNAATQNMLRNIAAHEQPYITHIYDL